MRLRILGFLAITLAVSVLMLGAVAQASDNQVGAWKLNLAKSKYSPGPPPKEGTLTIESQANGLKFTIHGTDAEGKPVHFEFSPKYDGKDYPVTGMPNVDTISMKKVDDYTIETVTKKGGKAVTTTKSVVSKDGKTRTTMQTGKNAQGQDMKNTLVYDKQ